MKNILLIICSIFLWFVSSSQNINMGSSKFTVVSKSTNNNQQNLENGKINNYTIKKAKISIRKISIFPEFHDFPENQEIKLEDISEKNNQKVELENVFQKIVYAINTTMEDRSIGHAFAIGFISPETIPYTDMFNRAVTRVGYRDYSEGARDLNYEFDNLGINMVSTTLKYVQKFDGIFKNKETATLNLYLFKYEKLSYLLSGSSSAEKLIDFTIVASTELPITSKKLSFDIVVHSSETGFNLEYIPF